MQAMLKDLYRAILYDVAHDVTPGGFGNVRWLQANTPDTRRIHQIAGYRHQSLVCRLKLPRRTFRPSHEKRYVRDRLRVGSEHY